MFLLLLLYNMYMIYKGASAAKHTYDTGYKKWESFDVDAELLKEEEAKTAPNKTVFTALSSVSSSNNSNNNSSNSNNNSDSGGGGGSGSSESINTLGSNPAASFFGSGPAIIDRSQVPVVPRARRALLR